MGRESTARSVGTRPDRLTPAQRARQSARHPAGGGGVADRAWAGRSRSRRARGLPSLTRWATPPPAAGSREDPLTVPTLDPSPAVPTDAAVPAVRLVGLVKRYGDVEAVAGIDLDIADGEFFSMLGPSGSGKTTTLRMIAGFEVPTAGRVELHGRDVTALAPFDRDVNTVFQDYALFPHMTVGDNVGYGLMVRKVAREERRVRVADALADGPPGRLRGAQAGAALRRPAPARRTRASPRQPPPRPPPRRTARRARPQAPRGDADRAQAHPAGGRHHLHLRDPRPGGGAHHERPPGRLQPRSDRAGRDAGGRVRTTADGIRRRIRRGIEPPARRSRPGDPRAVGHVHHPPREDPPGRRRRRRGPRRGDRAREDRRGRLPRVRHPLPRDARRRGLAGRHAPEPGHLVDGGARAPGHAGPARLEAEHAYALEVEADAPA